MKHLVICEKPSVAASIASALGGSDAQKKGDYYQIPQGYVTSCIGHLLGLADAKIYDSDLGAWRWDTLPLCPPDMQFKLVLTKEEFAGRLTMIKTLMKDSDCLVNACDAGREGELIWWNTVRHCGWSNGADPCVMGSIPAKRFWIQASTPEAIRTAWDKMKGVETYLPLARSAHARSEGDWLLGINLSRGASLTFPRSANAQGKRADPWVVGRVQTPTLALVVGRDQEIANFKSRGFFEIRLDFKASGGDFETTLLVPKGNAIFHSDPDNPASDPKAFSDRAEASILLSNLKGKIGKGDWTVADEVTESKERPPGLFDLTSLQRYCAKNLDWSASATLAAAQAAYETDKTLTYPRTDFCFLPEVERQSIHDSFVKIKTEFVDPKFGSQNLEILSPDVSPQSSRLFDDSKIGDHSAIMPTGVIPKDLTSPSGMVWLIVVRRVLLAFSKTALANKVARSVSDDGGHVAVASGKVYLDRGWMALDDVICDLTGDKPKSLPGVLPETQGTASLLDGRLHEGKTTPPKPLTEDTLLGLMENVSSKLDGEGEEELRAAMAKKGLGTPATRAAVIERLIRLSYLARKKGKAGTSILSTPDGISLIESLRSLDLGYLTEPVLTAEWEFRLEEMAKATSSDTRESFISDLYDRVVASVSVLKKSAKAAGIQTEGPKPVDDVEFEGKLIVDHGNYWKFGARSALKCWKTIASREMSVEDYVSIFSGQEPVFEGFLKKDGTKTFSAALVVDEKEDRLSFFFPPREGVSAAIELDVKCPKSKKPIKELEKSWIFPGVPGVYFNKVIAKREMKIDEYCELVSKRKVGPLEGFISKADKPFSASLKIAKDKGVTFDFGPKPDAKSDGKFKSKK